MQVALDTLAERDLIQPASAGDVEAIHPTLVGPAPVRLWMSVAVTGSALVAVVHPRGRPSTFSAMMLRWISEDPAEMVAPKLTK